MQDGGTHLDETNADNPDSDLVDIVNRRQTGVGS